MTDLYSTLDIPASAAQAEIKRAYRKAAKRHHPDTPTGSQEAFQKLTRAYLVLSDPARREKYDRTGDIDEETVDNTFSQAVSIIIGALMSAVDGYVKGATSDPSAEDMVDVVRSFVRKNVTNFENQKRQMEKAQASLKDIAKRWSAINPTKGNKKPQPGAKFLKQAIDQQAAGTEEPLRKINQQIETYKLALELLANSSFNPAQHTKQVYQPMSRTWTTITF
jgi:curved DNA-binding protein CbpA